VEADEAVVARLDDRAVAAMLSLAEVALNVSPFKPRQLPENWRELLELWVRGATLGEIREVAGAEGVECVEEVFVYRLVWAMEATRARAVALDDEGAGQMNGRAALALETGTMNLSAAVLLQAGLASRVAAFEALRICPGDFTDRNGMRDWLWSADVLQESRRRDWPTPDTHDIWHDFVSGSGTGDGEWVATTHPWSVQYSVEPPPRNTPLRIFHEAHPARSWVCTREFDRIGTLVPPLPRAPEGLLWATAGNANELSVTHIGPEADLRAQR
jgi:hypothetical protein